MPGTLWSAPSGQQQSASSLTTSSFTTATLTDISPAPCLIPAGTLNLGTRVRLFAAGSYTATTTASALKWGFYMNQAGTPITTTEAILAETASTAAAVATSWPWELYYSGVMQALSVNQNATTAKIVGQGWSMVLPTSLTAWGAPAPMPLTAALRTVTQTATGLNTETTQNVMLGLTVATNTGFSSVTVDELTCELIG
jgi:hypothetical protein